jgi:hypothetical protein
MQARTQSYLFDIGHGIRGGSGLKVMISYVRPFLFPQKNVRNRRCPACGALMSVALRADYEILQSASGKSHMWCRDTSCILHPPINTQSTAENLDHRTDLIEDALRELRQRLKPVDYTSLAPLDALYLYCILVVSKGDWYENELPSVAFHGIQLAPTRILTEQIYSRMRDLGILVPSLHSSIFAFNIGDSPNSPITFNTYRVRWTLPSNIFYENHIEIMDGLRDQLHLLPEDVRAQLYITLSEHELVRIAANSLQVSGAGSEIHLEAQLQTAVRPVLGGLSIEAAQEFITTVLSSSTIKKFIRSKKSDDAVRHLREEIQRRLGTMREDWPLVDCDNVNINSLLASSKCLISRVFFKRILRTM